MQLAPPRRASRLDGVAVGLMLLLCGLWGVQQVASKVALLEGMPPLLQALLRSALASPLLLAWSALRYGRPGLRALLRRDGTLGPGLLTAAMFALEFILLFQGMQLTTASSTVVLLFSGGLFTALGTHLFVPGEQLSPVNWAGLALAFLGVVATMANGAEGGGSLVGDALVLASAITWGSTTVVIKASRALAAAPAEKVLGYQVVGSLPVLIVTAAVGGELHVPVASGLAWASLLFQGAVIAFGSYLVWFWLVGRYPAGRLAAFSFLTPLMGVIAAWLLLGEPLTPMVLVGMACVAAGLQLVNRA